MSIQRIVIIKMEIRTQSKALNFHFFLQIILTDYIDNYLYLGVQSANKDCYGEK